MIYPEISNRRVCLGKGKNTRIQDSGYKLEVLFFFRMREVLIGIYKFAL